MNTMKAIRVHTHGGPEVLTYENVPQPQPAPSEVLLQVTGAGVNPADWKTRAGRGMDTPLPYIPGWDVAGVVEATGSEVTTLSHGDTVLGLVRFPHPGHTYAEYTAVPAHEVIAKPTSMTPAEAAALPLAGLTAWQGLIETAQLTPGQRVLVLGAAGGVGHLAVQIAKARGAYVIGTASQGNATFLHDLGVDEVVDYRHTRIEDRVHNIDVIFNAVSEQSLTQAIRTLRTGGTIVSIAGQLDVESLRARGFQAHRILVRPQAEQLRELVALVNAGSLRVVVEAIFPLSEAASAHTILERGHVRGKLVLDPTLS